MSDPYKSIRSFLGHGNHYEGSSRICGSLVRMDESATTDLDQDGIVAPGDDSAVGIRLPKKPGTPFDPRPHCAYGPAGEIVGIVHPISCPAHGSQMRGEMPEYEVRWKAQRIVPDGAQEEFDSEKDAKDFVADGVGKVTWYAPKDSDPWESLMKESLAQVQAVSELVDKIKVRGPFGGAYR
jgi:hypothetical protein